MPSRQNVDWRKTVEPLKLELLSAAAENVSVFHAIISTSFALSDEQWKWLTCGPGVSWGRETWFQNERIHYCYFLPAHFSPKSLLKSGYQALGRDVLEPAKASLLRFKYLSHRCVAVLRSIPHNVLLPNQDIFEEWLPTIYRLCWDHPNKLIQAQPHRIFKALSRPPFDEANYHSEAIIRIPLEHPDAKNDRLFKKLTRDGKTCTQEFSMPIPHAYCASLTPDIFTASAYALSLLCQDPITPHEKYDGGVHRRSFDKGPNSKHKASKPKDLKKAEKILRAINKKRKQGSSIMQAATELAEEDKSLGTPGAIAQNYYRYNRFRRNQKAPTKNKPN
jgi:hypothetical protein